MARVVRTEAADDDIAAIWAHIAEHNRSAATKWYSQLDEVLKLLESYPKLASIDRRLGKPYRSVTVGSYIAFYRFADDDNLVFLLRVCHAARKIEDIITPED